MKIGFDNKKYVKIQSEKIKERFNLYDKLYLEIGGKLFDDYHASRVLPGFKSDVKINMFNEIKNDLEIIFCINANDIEKSKIRAEHGITYDIEILRLIDNLTKLDFSINSVVITLYNNQPSVDIFIKKLKRHNIKTYIHKLINGYPKDIDTIVSDNGYGANPYIKTTKKVILVNAPGPGSGKLAVCLSQLYHEHKNGVNAGYAKFETFPVWNLDLSHPVNKAYESATADLKDVNMIDTYHLNEYNVNAVNYNRDIESFPVLKSILDRITGSSIYKSPTDMGVNMVGNCIINNEIVENAAKKEIVRRYFQEMANYKLDIKEEFVPIKIKKLMEDLNINEDLIEARKFALKKAKDANTHAIAINLDGTFITGKESKLLSAPSALIINTIKTLSNIPDNINLLSPTVLEPILDLQKTKEKRPLQLQEVLIALSVCSVTNPIVKDALNQLKKLENKEVHSSYIITNGELKALKELKLLVTCEPNFYSNNLYLEK